MQENSITREMKRPMLLSFFSDQMVYLCRNSYKLFLQNQVTKLLRCAYPKGLVIL